MSLLPTPSSPVQAHVVRGVTSYRLREPHSGINQASQDTVSNVLTMAIRYNGEYLTFQSDYMTAE